MNNIKFSVVMAAYNGDIPKFIFQAGRSVFEQTCIPDELIVVYDGKVSKNHKNQVNRLKKFGKIKIIQIHKY